MGMFQPNPDKVVSQGPEFMGQNPSAVGNFSSRAWRTKESDPGLGPSYFTGSPGPRRAGKGFPGLRPSSSASHVTLNKSLNIHPVKGESPSLPHRLLKDVVASSDGDLDLDVSSPRENRQPQSPKVL